MDIQRQGQLVEVLGSEMSNKYSVNTADSSANTKTHSFGGRFLISEPVVKFFHDGRELKISPNKDEDPYAAIARYVFELNDEIEKLKSELAKAQAVPEGFVLVPVKEIKEWYLDDSESIYREDPDWLCDISIGEVVEVEHRVSYELDQDPVFAAIQWDEENGDVGYYETFKTKAEAEKVAAHCKAMVEAQEPAND